MSNITCNCLIRLCRGELFLGHRRLSTSPVAVRRLHLHAERSREPIDATFNSVQHLRIMFDAGFPFVDEERVFVGPVRIDAQKVPLTANKVLQHCHHRHMDAAHLS